MYDYLKAVKEGVKTALTDGYKDLLDSYKTTETAREKESVIKEIEEKLWIDDSVTGNASGSYTFSIWEAEENLSHNMDLLTEALSEFGCDMNSAIEKGAEYCDVAIRCYLLGQALAEALEELEVE